MRRFGTGQTGIIPLPEELSNSVKKMRQKGRENERCRQRQKHSVRDEEWERRGDRALQGIPNLDMAIIND